MGAPERVVVDGTAVVVADLGGRKVVASDRCPHRGAPLSAGTIEDGCLVCPYHGWRFGPDGRAVEIPALGDGAALPPRARLDLVDGDTVPPPERAGAARDLAFRHDAPWLRRAWHPVCRSVELSPASSLETRLLGETIRVVREADGTVDARPAFAAVDHIGHVWVAPDEPRAGLLAVPELDEPGWFHVPMPSIEGRYGVGLLLDNQIDAGHFSFVHRRTFGSAAGATIPAYDLERRPWGFETTFAVPISGRNDSAALRGERPMEQHRTMTYRYEAPAALFLQLDYAEMGGSTAIVFCITPLEPNRARMDVDLYFCRPEGFTEAELAERLAFEVQVVGEDMALQDLFEIIDLPLDPTAEVHTRADKASVEMRRILQRLAVSTGCEKPVNS